MKKRENRIVFVDTETAGLSARAEIIEVAAIAVESGTYRELDSIDIKIEFDMQRANRRSLGVNKFSPTAWEKYAIPKREAAEKFSLFLKQNATEVCISKKSKQPYSVSRMAAHNVDFDMTRLRSWYKRLELFFPGVRRALCTEQAARWFFENNQGLVPPRNYKLETLAEYFSLPTPDHTALADTRTCLALARTLAEQARNQQQAA